LAENLILSGSGSGRFQTSDPDLNPVKNRPDLQHGLTENSFDCNLNLSQRENCYSDFWAEFLTVKIDTYGSGLERKSRKIFKEKYRLNNNSRR
jgi:hypothetical protein